MTGQAGAPPATREQVLIAQLQTAFKNAGGAPAVETRRGGRAHSPAHAPHARRAAARDLDTLLALVPSRCDGMLSTAIRYLPAGHLTQMGGDIYDVVPCDDGALLLIADVRGKGDHAAQLARLLLRVFRAIAFHTAPDLCRVAAALDECLSKAGTAEDFATAVLVRYHRDGRLESVACGHPAPLVVTRGGIRQLHVDRALPLGLGTRPIPASDRLAIGDRLLLYTDGLIEARDAAGGFFPLLPCADVLRLHDLETALDALLGRVVWHARGAPDDDLALLLAERRR